MNGLGKCETNGLWQPPESIAEMLDTLKAIQPNMTHSLARLERPPRKLLHVTHPSRIVKAVAAAKFFFSYFRRFSSTTSFEEKVRIVNNLSDSLTDDKRKYSRNFLATTRPSTFQSFLTILCTLKTCLVFFCIIEKHSTSLKYDQKCLSFTDFTACSNIWIFPPKVMSMLSDETFGLVFKHCPWNCLCHQKRLWQKHNQQ